MCSIIIIININPNFYVYILNFSVSVFKNTSRPKNQYICFQIALVGIIPTTYMDLFTRAIIDIVLKPVDTISLPETKNSKALNIHQPALG